MNISREKLYSLEFILVFLHKYVTIIENSDIKCILQIEYCKTTYIIKNLLLQKIYYIVKKSIQHSNYFKLKRKVSKHNYLFLYNM